MITNNINKQQAFPYTRKLINTNVDFLEFENEIESWTAMKATKEYLTSVSIRPTDSKREIEYNFKDRLDADVWYMKWVAP